MPRAIEQRIAEAVDEVRKRYQPSRRGELIAFVGLIVAAASWYGQDRQEKGAMMQAKESNTTLLAQRNRENDKLELRIASLEAATRNRNCQP